MKQGIFETKLWHKGETIYYMANVYMVQGVDFENSKVAIYLNEEDFINESFTWIEASEFSMVGLAKGGIVHNPKLTITPEKVINEKSNLNNLDRLFNFMVDEHDLILTEGQLSDIIHEVNNSN